MVEQTKPIAESKNFIVLDKYTSDWSAAERLDVPRGWLRITGPAGFIKGAEWRGKLSYRDWAG